MDPFLSREPATAVGGPCGFFSFRCTGEEPDFHEVHQTSIYRPRGECRRCTDHEEASRQTARPDTADDQSRVPSSALYRSRDEGKRHLQKECGPQTPLASLGLLPLRKPRTGQTTRSAGAAQKYRSRAGTPLPLPRPPWEFDASVCLEDCQGFVAGLGLPTEIGEALYAELEAEGTLQSSEEIRIPPADMEWLVGHFGPQIDIRFLLYRPQLVPALRRCVDFGLELPKSGLQAEELSEAPDRASTPSCRPASRVGFGSRASTRPPSSAQSPSPRLRSDPWSRQVEDRASEAEDLGLDAEKDASQRVAREWGFERGHGPFPPARRRKPASQWGFERRHSVREDGPDRWVSQEVAGVPFAASSSPTYDSSLMALAVGALQSKEADKDRLLFAERTVGLFQALSPPRGPAGALVEGGCRAFADHARSAWDEYRADVQHFQNTVYRRRGRKGDKERRRPMSANHAAVSARLYKTPASRPRTF